MPGGSRLYVQWSQRVRGADLFRPGERVGVAVSGGPDSVLLLTFMNELGRQMGFALAVAHFNHHLRGAESDADEQFVRGLAERLGLPFLRGGAHVAKVARARRQNLEATARQLRYRWFLSLVRKGQFDKVATAHTANDQAETVLLRLLRGTGTRGLGGIYPVLEGVIVRPFLTLRRHEIERELRLRNLTYRIDSSNLSPTPLRNKVRLRLLPILQKEYSPEIVRLLKDLADRARDDEALLEQLAQEQARPWLVREETRVKIPLRAFLAFHPAVARRVLRHMIAAVRGGLTGVTHAQIEALRRLATGSQSGRRLLLPGGTEGRREFDWLVVCPPSQPRPRVVFADCVTIPGEVMLPQLGLAFQFKFARAGEVGERYNQSEEVRLDASRLCGELTLRNWRPGDRFCLPGRRKACKLKELFGRRRIPRGERDGWPVLEDGHEIVWVRGFPPSQRVTVTADSAKILSIVERRLSPA